MEKLNKSQKQAVEIGSGPALIVAGAGTGKTRVIVERINKLLDKNTESSRILALTFTEKAAAEMLDRLSGLRGVFAVEVPIMTFNAYGEAQLRRFSTDIGLGHNFKLMGDSAKIVFLRERLDELGLDYFAPVSSPDSLLGDIANYFSLLKQNVISPDQYLKFVTKMPGKTPAEKLDKQKHQELARAYDAYLKLCRVSNVIDYDDQIYLWIDLLTRRPNILRQIQDSYDYVMVDEFQDTNAMQAVMVDLLVGRSKNLFVVGDDDQSIYGWRGATLANILDFKKRYPKAQEVTLRQNYRSTQTILDSAYKLITHNNPERLEKRLGIDKRLEASRKGTHPVVHDFQELAQELHWVASDIKRRLKNGTSPADIAVLARRNATVQAIHEYLDFEGVEHIMTGQRYELYHEPIVRTLLAAIQNVVDPNDSLSLYYTLSGPLFDLPASLIGKLASSARRQHQTLLEAAEDSDDQALKDALSQIASWRGKVGNQTVGQLTYLIFESSGYKDKLYTAAQNDPISARSVMRLSELLNTMKEFEQVALIPSAIQYVQALPALQAAGDYEEDDTLDLSSEKVNLMTVHKAKGLEWPIVYIVDASEGSFPLRDSSQGLTLPEGLKSSDKAADEHIREERRLMYVAMTRAKDELILTFARRHGSGAARKPSRFLIEAFNDQEFSVHQLAEQTERPNFGRFSTPSLTQIELPGNILQNGQLNLSVSQIKKFLDCPLDFYYRYVLNIPQETTAAIEYGKIMHSLIETINHSLVAGQLIKLSELKQQLRELWSSSGYLSIQHQDRAKALAERTLAQFYKRSVASPQTPVAVEQAFNVHLQDIKLHINGRFDAVLPMDEGVEIVDYKTSQTATTAEKAKSRASASPQLTLYALAWQNLHGELPKLVSLDFVDTGIKGSVRKTQKSIDSMVTKLEELAQSLRNNDFRPGKNHDFCQHPPL